MNLNHLNLTVTDVPGTQAFLVEHFGLKDIGATGGNINMAFLSDDSGLVLSLTCMQVGGDAEVRYPSRSTSASFSRARSEWMRSIGD